MILNEFFNYPREKAIFPNKSDVFDISVCYKLLAEFFTSAISSSQFLKLASPYSSSPN